MARYSSNCLRFSRHGFLAIHDMAGVTAQEGGDILGGSRHEPASCGQSGPSVMRGDDAVFGLQQRIVGPNGLHCDAIQRGAAKTSLIEAFRQVRLHYQSTPRGVNEKSVRLAMGKQDFVHHACGFLGLWAVWRDNIRLRKKLRWSDEGHAWIFDG